MYDFDAFMSHSTIDKPKVRRLASRLRDDGMTVWYDEWCIPVGGDIFAETVNGLEHSRTLVLCMSSSSLKSDWVEMERNTALFRDPTNRERRFIPVLLDDCKRILPDTIKRFRYVDLRRMTDGRYQEVLRACNCAPRSCSRTDVGSTTGKLRLTLDLDFSKCDSAATAAILALLRQLSGDEDLEITSVDEGSTILTVEASVEACRILKSLADKGDLSRLCGVQVIEATMVDKTCYAPFRVESHMKGQVCRRRCIEGLDAAWEEARAILPPATTDIDKCVIYLKKLTTQTGRKSFVYAQSNFVTEDYHETSKMAFGDTDDLFVVAVNIIATEEKASLLAARIRDAHINSIQYWINDNLVGPNGYVELNSNGALNVEFI
jgi:TIR domain-containing protein